ncbi:hypothetical protein ACIO87_13145 [Streptomyces sp. NPDC087218]|uniref:hypothetical protein n=1 Tax=Streptomyces sp. NPDC087218 TaxID=3365769 RepID=UPI00382F585E
MVSKKAVESGKAEIAGSSLGGGGAAAATGGARGFGRAARSIALPVALAVGLVLGGPAVGSADAVSACTGRLAKTVPFKTGKLHIYKSRSYACAMAVAKESGPRRSMSVTIQARGGSPVTDRGKYTKQAGPVTVHALNRCVRASAKISGASAATGWILC